MPEVTQVGRDKAKTGTQVFKFLGCAQFITQLFTILILGLPWRIWREGSGFGPKKKMKATKDG